MTREMSQGTGRAIAPTDDPDPRLPRLTRIPAFREFMASGWLDADRHPELVPGAVDAAHRHRRRLSHALPGRSLVVAAGRAPVRVGDTYHAFRPHSDYAWLVPASVEGAVLVFTPAGSEHDVRLYLPVPAVAGDVDFFGSAQFGELWVGPRPSLRDWSDALGVEVRPLAELDAGVPSDALRAGAPDGRLADLAFSEPLARTLARLRMVKDAWELEQLQRAVELTVAGFAAVAAELRTAVAGGGERWLQGTFDRHARTYGNDVGYATIVGSGRHAPTLHWVRCDGPVRDGELVLLDMGVEAKSLYTADVTRTLPVSGAFSAVQREVHDLVEKAHRAGVAAVGPGRSWTAFHDAAMAVIAQGVHDWGLLPVSVDEALSPEGQHHRRWLCCGIGHHLGLDVHDCSDLSADEYQGAVMEPGFVLTVEPGLYFHESDGLVPPELRGIGVRIEQDLVVTAQGVRILDEALPVDAAGLERWMSGVVSP